MKEFEGKYTAMLSVKDRKGGGYVKSYLKTDDKEEALNWVDDIRIEKGLSKGVYFDKEHRFFNENDTVSLICNFKVK